MALEVITTLIVIFLDFGWFILGHNMMNDDDQGLPRSQTGLQALEIQFACFLYIHALCKLEHTENTKSQIAFVCMPIFCVK